jgi:hypothetical protein
MKRITVFAAFLLLAFAVTGFKGCGKTADLYRAADGYGIPTSDIQFTKHYTTPGGSIVDSVVDVPPAALQALDDGVRIQIEAINRARPDWNLGRTLKEYRFAFIEPTRNGVTGQRCVNVETDPGSPCLYIKGIQTAGTVLGIQPFSPLKDHPVIVLPHQGASGWSHLDYLRNSARNESEHRRECFDQIKVDGKYRKPPECLQYQGANDVPPHFP